MYNCNKHIITGRRIPMKVKQKKKKTKKTIISSWKNDQIGKHT